MADHHIWPLILAVACVVALAPATAAAADEEGAIEVSGCLASQTEPAPKAHVEVRSDAGVFTVFALLNLTGYDWENAQSFHPVRARVREEMAAKLPSVLLAEFAEFRKEHPDHIWHYEQFVLQTDGAPHFRLLDAGTISRQAASEGYADSQREQLRATAASLAGLDAIVRKAWEVSAVRKAYADSEEEALRHGHSYAAALEKGLEAAVAYLRADPGRLQIQYVLVPNLLMSHMQNGGHQIGNAFIEVFGPRGEGHEPLQRPMESAHEFVHGLVAPVTRDPARSATYSPQLEELFRRAMAYEEVRHSYGRIEGFVEECLVKALDGRILDGPPPAGADELARSRAVGQARRGYLLAPWFYEKLADYDRGSTDFAAWFDRALSGADSEKVLERLDELGVVPRDP